MEQPLNIFFPFSSNNFLESVSQPVSAAHSFPAFSADMLQDMLGMRNTSKIQVKVSSSVLFLKRTNA